MISSWRSGRAQFVPGQFPGTLSLVVLGFLLVVALCWSAATGAFAISPSKIPSFLWQTLFGAVDSEAIGTTEYHIFMHIRMPRLCLGIAAGAALGISGALMQGLFRNPLADPGLVGVSSGAALGAALCIVLAGSWQSVTVGGWGVMAGAFIGALGVTSLICLVARTSMGTSLTVMLLAGIAFNALSGAVLGFLSYVASDAQLRSLQFWMLGSLEQAGWSAVGLLAVVITGCLLVSLRLARSLDVLSLGEAQAATLGVRVERVKRTTVVVTTLAVGTVTAATGMVGFIGLVAPHLVRLIAGPAHQVVLPGSALAGALLVIVADTIARTAIAPAALPLGVLTALIGAPFFLLQLLSWRQRL